MTPSRRTAALLTRVLPVLLAALAAAVPPRPAPGATFTVDSSSDEGDDDPGDGACFSAAAGGCTLRAAIEEANALGGRDRIEFSIPGPGVRTIAPLTPLPYTIEDVAIDGWTQGGAGYHGQPLLQLSGGLADDEEEWADADVYGLYVRSGSAVIRGLKLTEWDAAILLENTGGNIVEGCRIKDCVAGIHIRQSPGNRIGGRLDRDANTLTGNSVGIWIDGEASIGNEMSGNLIGYGDAADPQEQWPSNTGISISGGASENRIGTGALEGRNVLTGNLVGIVLRSGAHGNLIRGNFIGTGADGAPLSSNEVGIYIEDSWENAVGGPQPGDGNLVSGNGTGIEITGETSMRNRVQGNRIGTDLAGERKLGSGYAGVLIDDAPGNVIGGAAEGEGNVISGNAYGVWIQGEASQGNAILGCRIGTDAAGASSIPNVRGVYLGAGASRNRIGGGDPGEGNLISGNDGEGIEIDAGSDSNQVLGNRIGTDASGRLPLGNGSSGILIVTSSGSRIGTIRPGEGNTIAFNQAGGVLLLDGSIPGSTSGNGIRGNSIFANSGLAIGLDGYSRPRQNDPLDADTGSNGWQNHPELEGAASEGGATEVRGVLRSLPDSEFFVDLYASAAGAPRDPSAAERYLGSTAVATDGAGRARFSVRIEPAVEPGTLITAAAVLRESLDTSELSPPVVATSLPTGETGRQVAGDCNQDGRLDISDTSCLLGFLFQGSPGHLPCGDGSAVDPANVALLDWQPDDHVDLSDAVAMLAFLFSGGDPHPLAPAGSETRGLVQIPGCPDVVRRA